LKKDEKTK
jgi:hypothetical protein